MRCRVGRAPRRRRTRPRRYIALDCGMEKLDFSVGFGHIDAMFGHGYLMVAPVDELFLLNLGA